MPVRTRTRRGAALAAALSLTACSTGAATEPPTAPAPAQAADPAAQPPSDASLVVPAAGPTEIVLVADLGPLPDGPGRAVVETTWTTDGAGTVRLVVDTPAGIAAQHVQTADEHWWWLHPEARRTIVDAEWIHFDLAAIEEVGGVLPDVVTEARQEPPQLQEIAAGDVVAGQEVQAVEVVDDGEVHLTVAGIEQPWILRHRVLPSGTTVDLPAGAVDVRDVPDRLRW